MLCFVMGGAGFIGSDPFARLFQLGHYVVAYDNFATRQKRSLEHARTLPRKVIHEEHKATQVLLLCVSLCPSWRNVATFDALEARV